jgi:hypothetical protein
LIDFKVSSKHEKNLHGKFPKKKHFLLTLHQRVGFVEKGNHWKGNHRINQIKVCTWQFFFRRENEHKQRGMLKKLQETRHFLWHEKKKIFVFMFVLTQSCQLNNNNFIVFAHSAQNAWVSID